MNKIALLTLTMIKKEQKKKPFLSVLQVFKKNLRQNYQVQVYEVLPHFLTG